MAESRPYPRGGDDERARVKVLYLGGTGRTGSTVVARLLGQHRGWFSAGEVAFLWRYGLAGHGKCSCGVPLLDCEVWGDVLARAGAATGGIDAARMVELRRRFWSVHLPLMVVPAMARRGLERLEEFPATVEQVYRAIPEVTGARVIVDSSKEPHYSYILRERTDVDLYFVHLVRDPRGVGHSWQRHRRELGLEGHPDTERRGPVRASVYYHVSNIAAEVLWRQRRDRYRLMRYEDFVADPVEAISQIARFVGEPLDPEEVLRGRSFVATEQHVAWGNPNRFEHGTMEIVADDIWRRKLGRLRSAALSTLCAPVARRYGYPWRRNGALDATRGELAAVAIAAPSP